MSSFLNKKNIKQIRELSFVCLLKKVRYFSEYWFVMKIFLSVSEHVYDPGVNGLNGDEYHQHGLVKETWEHMDSFNSYLCQSMYMIQA